MKYTPDQFQPIIQPVLENLAKFAENKLSEGFNPGLVCEQVSARAFDDFGKIEPDALRQAYATVFTNDVVALLMRQRTEKKLRAAVEKFQGEISKTMLEDE